MRGFLTLLLMFLAAGNARAHLGFENEIEVRVYADRMRVVIRTSLPFAWTMLGVRAPAGADEAGQAVAKPLLIEAAPSLVTVTSGGRTLVPREADCIFEVHEDVAFILTFERPAGWPAVIEANYFPMLGQLDTGNATVFDHTHSRFSRDLEPLARKLIDRGNPSISFSLEPPAAPAVPSEMASSPPSAAKVVKPAVRSDWIPFLILLAAGIPILFLVRARLRHPGSNP